MRKLHASRLVSVATASIVATLGVVALTFAATTISTNINTGGTLTVSGASTLTGSLSAAGSLYASSTLNITATSTFTGDALFSKGVGIGADNSVAKTILISGLSTAPDSSEGRLYYNSGSKVLQLYDGTQWANVATSTGGAGLDVSGSRLQLNSLNSYLTIGTTTQQGLSMLTLEATSTAGIPLTLVARNSQTAHLLNVRNSGSSDLLYVDSGGGLFGSSTLQIGGVVTTYGNMTLGDAAADVLTINAGIAGFVSTASSTVVGDLTTSGQLRASSTSLFTGALTTYGNVTLGDAASDAIVLTGNASTTNSLTVGNVFYVGGYATTSGTTGNIQTAGSIVASTTSTTLQGIGVATSTPAAEFAAGGSATTTVYLTSTGTNKGGCLQLLGTNGTFYRMYVAGSDTSTTTTSGHNGLVAIWETGSCK